MRLFSKVKKIVCYVLIFVMILSNNTYASEYVEHSDEIVEIESMIETAPVLSRSCDLGTDVIVYEPLHFIGLLNNCKEVKEVSQIGDIISVYYETLKEQEIMILYKDGMVVQKSVYDKGEDVLTVTFEDGEEVIENFRSSSIYKTPQEILECVEDAIENKDYDELKSIEGVSVNVVNDTMVIDYKPLEIDIANEYTERIAITPRAASSFVAPETQFVPYTKKVVATSYKYNSTLNKNVKISVKESMNSYVKEQADLRSFTVGTALSAIASYLSLPASTAVKVLTTLGVLNSAKDAITQTITLYKSASYIYTGAKEGYAYDTTVYNKDVKVYFNSSKGTLHGGYNSSGEFTWIDYKHATALDVSNNTIINKTSTNYNADILDDGICTVYYPD